MRLLQRLRDEAHRFANGYHQVLMKQRVSEASLDECPGVSENRKKLLLRHFGSIEKLRHATAEEICAIEGIGPKLAENVATYLANHKRRAMPSEDETNADVPGPRRRQSGKITYRLKPQRP